MGSPLIGVTVHRQKSPSIPVYQRVGEASIESISAAGACPVMIPLGLAEEQLQALLPRLDGLLFTGGGDVQPERYNSHPHPLVQNVDEDRDQLEITLVDLAVRQQIPFFGICRGLQVINVALGGSLYEDLLEQRPGSMRHDFDEEFPRDHLAHPVSIQADTHLRAIIDTNDLDVNSLHHQGIQRLAPPLCASAHSPDGLVEAVEVANHPFGMAVQWHPECLPEHELMQRLFRAFVEAAGAGR